MPLDGFRWSCDSDSALCDILQTNVFGRTGGRVELLFSIIFPLWMEIPVGGNGGGEFSFPEGADIQNYGVTIPSV